MENRCWTAVGYETFLPTRLSKIKAAGIAPEEFEELL
jgi:hypothetical protein